MHVPNQPRPRRVFLHRFNEFIRAERRGVVKLARLSARIVQKQLWGSSVIGGRIEAHALYVELWGTLPDPSAGGGSAPQLQNFRFLILKMRIFCRLLCAKIYLYNDHSSKILDFWSWKCAFFVDCYVLKFIFTTKRCQNRPTRTYGMHGGWRWTCDNKKQPIHCQYMS